MPDGSTPSAPTMLERRAGYLGRLARLKAERSLYDQHWRDLARFVAPRRSRFFTSDTTAAGQRKNQAIINSAATLALRTLAAGMMAGITSPARAWFRLSSVDPLLDQKSGVKLWLNAVQNAILAALSKSNVYKALHQLYGDLGLFGTGVLFIEADSVDVVRAYSIPIGEYCLALSARGQVDTLFRETLLTVRQIVDRFGIDACSPRVRSLYEKRMFDTMVEVLQVIEPRQSYDPSKLDQKNMPWASIWMERSAASGVADQNAYATDGGALGLLWEGGYRQQPFVAPRWLTTGANTYGDSPGMDALGDCRELQQMERKKAQAVELMIDPPMIAPGTMRNKPMSRMPGSVTYIDGPANQHKFEPSHVLVPGSIQAIDESSQLVTGRINDILFARLWLMISNGENDPAKTATEVQAIEKEKLLQLGPVMESLDDELLNILIERVFGILVDKKQVPPPPPELAGRNLQIEFLSIMSAAQKMVGISSLQQFSGLVGNIAQLKPDVLDVVDGDVLVQKIADGLDIPADVLVPDDKVAAMRQQKAQAAAQQAQQQQAMAGAEAAKTLSETDMGGDTALSRTVGPVAAAQTQ